MAYAGLGLPLIRRRVARISKRVLEKAPVVSGELSRSESDRTAIEQFTNIIRDRADRCATTVAGALSEPVDPEPSSFISGGAMMIERFQLLCNATQRQLELSFDFEDRLLRVIG